VTHSGFLAGFIFQPNKSRSKIVFAMNKRGDA
jgi:hypothetical protein